MNRSRLAKILSQVERRVTPTLAERKKVRGVVQLVRGRIMERARRLRLDIDVIEVGSVAKDTWIKGDRDIDVFILFPRHTTRAMLEGAGLALARYVAGANYVEAYAEHPYVEAHVEGYVVDIVPSVKVERPDEAATAVDRTPFHKQFVTSRMDDGRRQQTRILKQFMKGVGVYGAEIRVRGFSGYLCELLIIHHGSFKRVIEEARNWQAGHVVDIQHHYRNSEQARQVFDRDPLVVVDPVDRRRNVASAVTLNHLAELTAAANAFHQHPSIDFFYPPKPPPTTRKVVAQTVRMKGTSLLAVAAPCPKVVPDVLWGQCYKTLHGLETLLERHDFEIVHSDAWSDETSTIVFLFELLTRCLPQVVMHQGPSVFRSEDARRFLAKRLASRRTITGPWIKDGRWVAQLERSHSSAAALLKEKWREARTGQYVADQFSKQIRIFEDSDVVKASNNKAYPTFLGGFLRRKPAWLRKEQS